jgi:hypothetical protein
MSISTALMLTGLFLSGAVLWILHADAWDLGRRSPVLNYDTSQYALAAREFARTGHLGTTFALPIELSRHATPPWPLAVVQPGLVMVEALMFKLVPSAHDETGKSVGNWARPDQREMLLLPFPFMCFLMIGVSLGLATRHLMRSMFPDLQPVLGAFAGLTLGLAFLLDPEAQHFAVGPFTELPFTFGLVGALAALALGRANERPFVFGLLLGITGSFRGNMLWLAPVLTLAAMATAPPGRRARVLLLVLLGFSLPLAPWWFYKWRAFGSPGFDLTRYVVWDGVKGQTWFSLYHLPEPPLLPHGLEAMRLLLAKVMRNLPLVTLAMLAGPRALWLLALVVYLRVAGPPRTVAVAGWSVLVVVLLSVLAAAASIPWLRYVFPARVLLEAAGLLSCWGLAAHAAGLGVGQNMRRALAVLAAVVALGWGGMQTVAGLAEAHETSLQRGTPEVLVMLKLAVYMNRELAPDEPVMSNLGPELAWHARRPVIHLALRPEDMAACRSRTEFRHVILCFRDPSKAWSGWSELMAHPVEASKDPALNILRTRKFESSDGFIVVWLELGPPSPRLAAAPRAPLGGASAPPTRTAAPSRERPSSKLLALSR